MLNSRVQDLRGAGFARQVFIMLFERILKTGNNVLPFVDVANSFGVTPSAILYHSLAKHNDLERMKIKVIKCPDCKRKNAFTIDIGAAMQFLKNIVEVES